MNEERVERRLAAILAADVVGYSRMMGMDEAGTLARLTAHTTDHIAPCIAAHTGRIVKTTGDGLLAEFASVVDAVNCALAFQEGMRARNKVTGGGADDRIEFRIGVNLGDIIAQDGDVFGDGVNIAARIEGICDPGGVFVSGTVYDHVQGKLTAGFESRGEQALKNIERPVRVYRVLADAASASKSPDEGTKAEGVQALPVSGKPSVAVLAFENMSQDPEQTYFAEGIAEDIITDLSKVSGLFVIARNSSFFYQGKSHDLRVVCRELGVRYILEGSVRRAGNRVRINAQLIDGVSGGHLWADRYDREIADIFAVQDEVTREIVGALKVALTADEESSREGSRTVDPVAYDLMIRGRDCLYRFTEAALTEARGLLEQAMAQDEKLAEAVSTLSLVFSTEHVNGWNGAGPDHLTQAVALAEKACRLAPDNPLPYHALALSNLWLRNFEMAGIAGEKSISLNSNFAGGYVVLANVNDIEGDHERAIEYARKGLSLDPHYHISMQVLGRSLFALGRDEEARGSFERRLVLQPDSDRSRIFLVSIHGHSGRFDEARRVWEEILEINPAFSLDQVRHALPYRTSAVFDRLVAGIEKAGIDV